MSPHHCIIQKLEPGAQARRVRHNCNIWSNWPSKVLIIGWAAKPHKNNPPVCAKLADDKALPGVPHDIALLTRDAFCSLGHLFPLPTWRGTTSFPIPTTSAPSAAWTTVQSKLGPARPQKIFREHKFIKCVYPRLSQFSKRSSGRKQKVMRRTLLKRSEG